MAGIVLSYASADREFASAIAAFLETVGHDVWWDTDLVSGDSFRSVIDKQLDAADVVVVIWTPSSVRSKWVIAEAEHADRLEKLLPLKHETILDWQIPKPFGTLHTTVVNDEAAIVKAVERIANRADDAPEILDGRASPEVPAASTHLYAKAESDIRSSLIWAGLIIIIGTAFAAYFDSVGNLRETFKAVIALSGCSVLAIWSASRSLNSCQRARNPMYSAILIFLASSIGILVWLILGCAMTYLMNINAYDEHFLHFDSYGKTFFGSVGAIMVHVFLLISQIRGRAFVLAGARNVAIAQGLFFLAHVGFQTIFYPTVRSGWFTDAKFGFLHLLYVSTHVSGLVITVAFLVASYKYAEKLDSSAVEASRERT